MLISKKVAIFEFTKNSLSKVSRVQKAMFNLSVIQHNLLKITLMSWNAKHEAIAERRVTPAINKKQFASVNIV